MTPSLLGIVRRGLSKPFNVVVFRLYQTIVLVANHRLGLWSFTSRLAERAVMRRQSISDRLCVAAKSGYQASEEQLLALKKTAEQVQASRFTIFGHPAPLLDTCDFSSDWRFQKSWPNQYFKRYHFYVAKEVPYDVKFPWELSRFHYLIPVLAWQVVGGIDSRASNWLLALIRRWRQENPLAYSVNWYPMEASMRSIYLVIQLDLVKLLRSREMEAEIAAELDALARQLLVMLLEHARFVWLNREYTDVRGNHFTANLVALQMMDQALAAENMGKRKWGRYARRWLEREVVLQFSPDGVNFEKSCGYHKLVLELFMLSAIAGARSHQPFGQEASDRLMAAAQFSDASTRTDGISAGFGDTDDALGLPFLIDRPRSHGLVVELARAWFGAEIGDYPFRGPDQWAALMLAGKVASPPKPVAGPELFNFPDGGYVIIRNRDNGFFLMIDIGEVGMGGRGGHGHNDLLAIELCINGRPILVDPGCSGYTADLAKKALFRSTAAHSTVQLYGEEIARFAGHWGIHNDAVPCDVRVVPTKTGAIIQAGHRGYARIQPGTSVLRTLDVNALAQRIVLRDEIETPCKHAEVRWHFPTGDLLPKVLHQQIALHHTRSKMVSVSATVPLSATRAPYSQGYGQEIAGNVITGAACVGPGRHVFQFQIELVTEAVANT